MKCPCCGHDMSVDKPRVDLNTNTFICFAGQVRLKRQTAELAVALLERAPGVVTYDTINQRLWGWSDPPKTSRSIIKAQTHYLRKAIAPFGFTIKALQDVGLRMTLPEIKAYAA